MSDRLERMWNAEAGAAPGLDVETVGKAVNEMVQAVWGQAKVLAGAKYKTKVRGECAGCERTVWVRVKYDPVAVSKAAHQCAAVVDQLTRLAEFSQGRPDSRPGDRDVLRALTAEQLAQVEAWVAEAERGRG